MRPISFDGDTILWNDVVIATFSPKIDGLRRQEVQAALERALLPEEVEEALWDIESKLEDWLRDQVKEVLALWKTEED